MRHARTALAVLGLLLVLWAVNHGIAQRERVLHAGTRLLLPLGQRDPRALLQGDYMAIQYDDSQRIETALRAVACDRSRCAARAQATLPSTPVDGYAVFRRDRRDVGRFVRAQRAPLPLKQDELAVRVRMRGDGLRIAGNAWFFPEGQGERFAAARYGELRVDDDGTALLTGLYDRDRKPL